MPPAQLPLPAALAAALMVMVALHLSAAAAAPAPIGLAGCNTTCGGVQVPYPFGYGPDRCSWPGLSLTCDTSQQPPRLLLRIGDVTLRVLQIFPGSGAMRVAHSGFALDIANDTSVDGWSFFPLHGIFTGGYGLSDENVVGILMGYPGGNDDGKNELDVISGMCSTFCVVDGDRECSGYGCGQAPIYYVASGAESIGVKVRWLDAGDHTGEQHWKPVKALFDGYTGTD